MKRPVVGSAMLIFNVDGDVLLARRISGKCQGWFAAPGGHVEWNESLMTAAIRETFEECGIKVMRAFSLGIHECIMPEEDHHFLVAVHVAVARYCANYRRLKKWAWFSPDKLPPKTLPVIKKILEA